MLNNAVRFYKGNLEVVAEMVHAYNKLIDKSIPEIQLCMLHSAYDLLFNRSEASCLETMCYGVRGCSGESHNVEFYFCPPHNNYILLEYRN